MLSRCRTCILADSVQCCMGRVGHGGSKRLRRIGTCHCEAFGDRAFSARAYSDSNCIGCWLYILSVRLAPITCQARRGTAAGVLSHCSGVASAPTPNLDLPFFIPIDPPGPAFFHFTTSKPRLPSKTLARRRQRHPGPFLTLVSFDSCPSLASSYQTPNVHPLTDVLLIIRTPGIAAFSQRTSHKPRHPPALPELTLTTPSV